MGDAEKNNGTPAEPFPSTTRNQESERNWVPMAVGGALVLLFVGAVVFFTSNSGANNGPDPYVSKLNISNLNMAVAQNFAGGSVTYIQGTVTNTGDRKVTGARVALTFRNSLGEVSQHEDTLPLMVLLPNIPIPDYGSLDLAPLAPGQSRDFRLTVEHVTADWNGQVPELKVVGVNKN